MPAAIAGLWAAYIFVLPFHRVWTLPWLGVKLQPPEIVALGLVATLATLWRPRAIDWRVALADCGVAAWVGAHAVGLVVLTGPRSAETFIQAGGAVYLAVLYAALRMSATPGLLDHFGEWFGFSAAIAAALGIAGSVASWMGYSMPLATTAATPIPYLGLAPRAQALTAGPQMLASILLMAVPLFVGHRIGRSWRTRDVVCVALLVAGLLATVSKTALCLIPVLTVMWACGSPLSASARSARRPRRGWIAATVSLTVAALFAIGSHVLVVRQATVDVMSTAQLVGGQPIASFAWNHEQWAVMPTTYTFNNKASLLAIARSWPAGVGPAGQRAFTTTLQRDGLFPWSIWITEPHSIYLGTVTELGVAGLAALALILYGAVLTIRRMLAGPQRFRWEAAAYAAAGVGFLIEGISGDLLNCRHYWVLLAVMVARSQSLPQARAL